MGLYTKTGAQTRKEKAPRKYGDEKSIVNNKMTKEKVEEFKKKRNIDTRAHGGVSL